MLDRVDCRTDGRRPSVVLGPAKASGPDRRKHDGRSVPDGRRVEVVQRQTRLVAALEKGKRNSLYLGPCQGSFEVMFILEDEAVAAARGASSARRRRRSSRRCPWNARGMFSILGCFACRFVHR